MCIFLVPISVGELESFRNYKGFSIIFPKILDAIYRFTKVRIVLLSFLCYIFESENFGFPFSKTNSAIWGVKCEKIKFRKS